MSYENVKQHFQAYNLADRIKELSTSSATVELAAAAVGCDVSQIAKTLSFYIE